MRDDGWHRLNDQFRKSEDERNNRLRRRRLARKGHTCAGGVELTYTAQGTLPCPECGATSKDLCARKMRRLAERDAVLTYLLEVCSYSYGGSSASEPSPAEMGISWEWRQTTSDKPGLYEALCERALYYFTQYVNEMDPDEEPTDWDREVMRYRTALAGAAAQRGIK